MARLFVGPKEQQFINDITKEFTKDIVGQYIVYYPVSMIDTKVHPVYDEAVEKVFENPIKLDVLAGQPERAKSWDRFGVEGSTKLELFVQARDLIDKGINITGGDFFTYGNEVYEVVGTTMVENIYGQVEYDKARKVIGQLSRTGQFDIGDFKELLEQSRDFDKSQVEKTFVQQRGLSETEEGPTADRREVRERLGDEMAPIALGEGPRKVDEEREDKDEATPSETSVFYKE